MWEKFPKFLKISKFGNFQWKNWEQFGRIFPFIFYLSHFGEIFGSHYFKNLQGLSSFIKEPMGFF
jgi:hypothetical protein